VIPRRAQVSQVPSSRDAQFVQVPNDVGLIEKDSQDIVCVEEKEWSIGTEPPRNILSSDG
jgi:hypothetical protein